ncbi:phage GP46 family protein [Paraburkholderia sp. A3BS-1L]|uniref:phage GP46 family protein n=1 Tax=Paraburkholderia sp. A3BS-1L TaxID=3028375 RepID=UPI003DA87DBA
MSDISVVWDVDNSRGDWSFEPLTVAGQQITVSNPLPFGSGDGVTAQFQLSAIRGAISGIISAQIYRNDWQGNQLLYVTARTNGLLWSQDFTQSVWAKQSGGVGTIPVVTGNYATGPDGVSLASRVQFSLNGGNTTSDYSRLTQNRTTVAGLPYAQGVWARSTDGVSSYQLEMSFNGQSPLVITVGPTWTLFSNLDPSAQDTSRNFRFNLRGASGTSQSADILMFGAMHVQGTTTGAYIPTTTAAVTVTDYTLTSVGLVALAATPAVGAALTWTGAYISSTVSGGDLARGNDLETAVLLSLFTDRAANPDDVIPDGTGDPRGWWGDIGEEKPIGSRLWLLDRSKQTQEVLNNARDYINEALQWLIDDGVVASIDVQTQWVRDTFLGAQITLYQPTGTQINMTYAWAWQQLS